VIVEVVVMVVTRRRLLLAEPRHKGGWSLHTFPACTPTTKTSMMMMKVAELKNVVLVFCRR